MATRVHELAKELGLKSQELLDRIQKWGMDVKASPLASLDPSTVDRIKELNQGTRTPAEPVRPTPPSPPEAPAIRPSPTTAAPTPAAPARPASPTPPAATAAPPPPPASTAPPPSAAFASRPAASPTPARPPDQNPPPLARPSGLSGAPRAGGPLSGHTPHRTSLGGATGRPGQSELRPNPTGPPPLRRPLERGDYISPAGTRGPLVGRSGLGGPAVRRPEGPGAQGPAGEPPRREAPPVSGAGPRRPLPPVAPHVASAPPPRRTDAPRSAGPESKTQGAEKKYTRQEMLAMMQAGKLGNAPGATPARPGGPPRPGQGLGSAPLGPRRPPAGAPPIAGSVPPAPTSEEEDDRKGKAHGRLGSAAERASRRAKRNDRSREQRVTSPVPASQLTGDEEERQSRGPRRSHKGRAAMIAPRKTHVELEPPVTVRSLSEAIGVKSNDLIRKLWNLGQTGATINASLDDDTAVMLAMEFGVEVEVVYERTAEDELEEAFSAQAEDGEAQVLRPPIITILGHVDHGKTSLLDRIRKTNVVASESGGITQHIGAYQVAHDGKKIAFVDTPGHEAFTAMRARGANVTDIVVLVVAADDGVMVQTREAIAHAKAAEVPVVVALNKIDLPNADTAANISKIYGELSQEGLNPEEWGGDTPVVKTSTVTGQGLDDLLATLDALAELHELKANPERPATGTCLEASKSEGRGVVATILVQDGTLRVGDVIVCGDGYGRVRALFDDRGQPVQEVGPSTPVEVTGLDEVPTAGEKFAVVDDITRAREIAETRRGRARGAALNERPAITLENLFSVMTEQKVKSLNLILKADVQGSLEALTKELEKLENPEVPIRVLLKAVGAITESDVLLADASEAIVIGFRVAAEDRATSLADEKKIDIRRYDIIYQVTDEIKKAVEGMLVPETKEVILGAVTVRQVFKISKVGAVAGCMVTRGTIERGAKARIYREGREIYKGAIDALKRFKDDVKEVREGFECGIKISNYDDIKVDDVIEAFRIDVIRRTL